MRTFRVNSDCAWQSATLAMSAGSIRALSHMQTLGDSPTCLTAMESYSCTKTQRNSNEIKLLRKNQGAGVPSTTTLTAQTANLAPAEPQAQAAESDTALCSHIDAAGRRCHMLIMSATSDLCAYHAQRRLQAQRGSETAAAELLACGTDFHDAESVNRFLGTLVRQLTLKRIPRRCDTRIYLPIASQ
jgi:hypothetical protein